MSEKLYEVQAVDVFYDDGPLPHRVLIFTSEGHQEVASFSCDRYHYVERDTFDSTYHTSTFNLERTVINPMRPQQCENPIDRMIEDAKKHLASTLIFDGALYDWYGRKIKAVELIKRVIAYFDTAVVNVQYGYPRPILSSYEYYIVELTNGSLSLAYLDYDKVLAERLSGLESHNVTTAKTAILCKPELKLIRSFFFKDFIEFATSDKPILRKLAQPISFADYQNDDKDIELWKKSPQFMLLGVNSPQSKYKETSIITTGVYDLRPNDDPSNNLPRYSDDLPTCKTYIKGKPIFSEDGTIMTIRYESNDERGISYSINCKDIPESKHLCDRPDNYAVHPWYKNSKP